MEQRHSSPTCVNCPTCGAPVEWSPAQHWRPFCSERCRLIDLGSWLDESHRIPADEGEPVSDESGPA
ncbi:MAG: DNA gyrase inhibitor YacG [Gammaproteobacteria bacterium]